MVERKSVLLATLDSSLRYSRQMLLESRGFAVSTSERTTGILDRLGSDRIDLLLLDHTIPWSDRATILEEAFRRQVPVLSVQPNISTIGETERLHSVILQSGNPVELMYAVEIVINKPRATTAQAPTNGAMYALRKEKIDGAPRA